MLPRGRVAAEEVRLGLADEGGGFERVAQGLAGEVSAGQALQVGVDEAKELVAGGRVAGGKAAEEWFDGR